MQNPYGMSTPQRGETGMSVPTHAASMSGGEEQGGQDNEQMNPPSEMMGNPAGIAIEETQESESDAAATFRPGWGPGVSLG